MIDDGSISKTNLDERIPNNIISWFITLFSGKIRKIVIVLIFVSIMGVLGFAAYQLFEIRRANIKQIGYSIFEEQWNRSDDDEWKCMLIKVWSNPSEIADKYWEISADKGAEGHPGEKARLTVARHKYAPFIWKDKLAKGDKILQIRVNAILNRDNYEKICTLLAEDRDIEVRKILAATKNIPKNSLKILMERSEVEILKVLAENTDVSSNTLEELSNNEQILSTVLSNPNVPEGLIIRMYNSLKKNVREELLISIAKNISTPSQFLVELANHKSLNIRNAVASNKNASAELLTKLSKDQFIEVRAAVASNPNTPSKVHYDEFILKNNLELIQRVACNSGASPATLLKISETYEGECSSFLAGNPQIPQKVLNDYIKNAKRLGINSSLASNPRVEKKLLRNWAKSPSDSIREQVAKNSNTEFACLQILGKDLNAKVRKAVAQNERNEDFRLLYDLLADKDKDVCLAALSKILKVKSDLQD